ncbi:hypothetical protein ACPYO6_12945 [Georgenia sp. Z1344]|uniref:hypothetical protein n=1 Tax=Georgenia sp. Z1344 TaxID=3416706 RepID=UPI003CEAC418
MHEYTSGRWIAVVGESAVALLDPSLGTDDARRLWDNDRDGERLSRWIEVLAARGITSLPPFALVEARDDGLFVLVRGDLTVRAGSRTVTGRGYSTWYEELVAGASDFEISAPEADGAAEALPVTTGIVLAASVVSRAPAGEEHAGLTVAGEDAEGAGAGAGAGDGEGSTDVSGSTDVAGSTDGDDPGATEGDGSGAALAAAGVAGAGLAGAGVAGAALAGAGDDAADQGDDPFAGITDADFAGDSAPHAEGSADGAPDAEAEAAAEGEHLVDEEAMAGDAPEHAPADGQAADGQAADEAALAAAPDAAPGAPVAEEVPGEGDPLAEGGSPAVDGSDAIPGEAADEAAPGAVEEGAATLGGEDAFQASEEQGAPGSGAPDAPEAEQVEGEGFADPYHSGAALEQSDDDDAHTDEPGRPDDAELAEALAAEDQVALTAEPEEADGFVGEGPDGEGSGVDGSGVEGSGVGGSGVEDAEDDGLIDNVPTWSQDGDRQPGADDAGGAPGSGDEQEGHVAGAHDDAEHTQIFDEAAAEGRGDEVPPVEEQPVEAHAVDTEANDQAAYAAAGFGAAGAVAAAGAAGGQSENPYGQDRADGGHGYGDHGDGDGGYGDQGHGDAGYGDQDQGDGGYGDHGQDDAGYGDHGYGDQGPGDAGYGEQGQGDGGYGDQGYGDQGGDGDGAPGYDQQGHGAAAADQDGHADPAGPDHDGATSMVSVGDYAEGLVLVLPDGTTVAVDRPVLLGRAPDATRFSGDDAPRIVQVRSPERDVSATHVEVRPAGDTVVVTDMDSTNGTVIVLPDQPAFRLHPRTGVPVPPGAYVELGTDAGFHVDVAGQVPEQ